jgi:hypothetical protein
MSNQVEQIRAEVERRIKSWQAGIKYEGDAGDCQSRVTELTDLKKFIDSLPAEENPILVPSDVQEAAHKAYPVDMLGDVHHPRLMIDRNQTKRESFIEGMLAERERLMKDAVEIDTDITINRYTKQHILHINPTDEHIQHLPRGEYKAIIIKKEK